MGAQDTICPSCESTGGEIGQPCHQKVCGKKGYHFIPRPAYMRYREWLKVNSSPEDPDIGRFIDRFLLIEKLGQGGMGAVYLALQTPLLREVALKVVSGLVLDDQARQRFEREAKAISILFHPNIVTLFDYGFNQVTGAPFMALEFIREGKELSDEIHARRERGIRWTKSEIIDIFTQILNGLAVAHRNGLVHRDMKPQNIMLTNVEGNPHFVKILDFGLSKALGKIPETAELTAKGLVMGTPKYMSPEQLKGLSTVDHRSDLYSVGTFLFEMISSLPLFAGKDTGEIFLKKLKEDYSPMAALPDGALNAEVEMLLRKALGYSPEERFQSAIEMKDALVTTLSAVGDMAGLGGAFMPFAPTMEMKKIDDAPSNATTYEIVHDFVTVTPAAGSPLERKDDETSTLPPGGPRQPARRLGRFSLVWAVVLAGGVVLLALVVLAVVYPWFFKAPATQKLEADADAVGAWVVDAEVVDAGVVDAGVVDTEVVDAVVDPSAAAEPDAEGEDAPEGEESALGLDFDKITDDLEELSKHKHARVELNDSLINNVMYSKSLWPKLNACVGKKKGTAIVRLIVSGKTGRVTSAKLLDHKFAGTSQGKCLLQVFKKHVTFPSFKHNDAQITRKYPFK